MSTENGHSLGYDFVQYYQLNNAIFVGRAVLKVQWIMKSVCSAAEVLIYTEIIYYSRHTQKILFLRQ